MAKRNCENCAREDCAFIPPAGEVHCEYWHSDAHAVNRWIPVEDALPDALQNVLICTDINTITIAWINGEGWTFADTGNGHIENWGFEAVKYWMNLPEPPEM